MAKIEACRYKDAPGWRLSDGPLEATVLQRGAKIQSLQLAGKELLWQNSGPAYRFSSYGDVFETGEFSGFDDMFPNISAGPYPGGIWSNTPLPDHGEVWTQDWACTVEENRLAFAVNGIRLPYRLEKTVALENGTLHLGYRAVNLTPYPMKYLWAAHPLFVLEEGTQLALEGCAAIVNAAEDKAALGSFGTLHPWPVCLSGRDLSHLGPSHRTYNKYYVWNPLTVNRSALRYPDGTTLTLDAPADRVPYLGVWTDECGYGGYGMACVAPEPCTGAFDRLDLADLYGRVSVLNGRGTANWTLTISIQKENTL